MEQAGSSILFKLGRIFAALVFVSSVIFIVALFFPEELLIIHSGNITKGAQPIDGIWDLKFVTIAISALTFLVSAIGTASTIFLGWRADRRQAKEMMMKIEVLETQLAAARRRPPNEDEPI